MTHIIIREAAESVKNGQRSEVNMMNIQSEFMHRASSPYFSKHPNKVRIQRGCISTIWLLGKTQKRTSLLCPASCSRECMEAKSSASLPFQLGGQGGPAVSSPRSLGSRQGPRPGCAGIQHARLNLPGDCNGYMIEQGLMWTKSLKHEQ